MSPQEDDADDRRPLSEQIGRFLIRMNDAHLGDPQAQQDVHFLIGLRVMLGLSAGEQLDYVQSRFNRRQRRCFDSEQNGDRD